jgi:hypothetical protein
MEPEGVPKGTKRNPRSFQSTPKEPQRLPREASRALHIHKLPINRPGGRYVIWLHTGRKHTPRLDQARPMQDACMIPACMQPYIVMDGLIVYYSIIYCHIFSTSFSEPSTSCTEETLNEVAAMRGSNGQPSSLPFFFSSSLPLFPSSCLPLLISSSLPLFPFPLFLAVAGS